MEIIYALTSIYLDKHQLLSMKLTMLLSSLTHSTNETAAVLAL